MQSNTPPILARRSPQMPWSLRILTAVVLGTLVSLSACHSSERAAPPLDKPTPPAPVVVRPNLLERTATATISALETPVHWVTPDKKPKPPVPTVSPADTQPAEAFIVSRRAAPQLSEVTTAPAPATLPATRP